MAKDPNKYKVVVKLVEYGADPQMVVPCHQEFVKTKADTDIVADRLQRKYPNHTVELRLLKGIRHNKPIRWRWEEKSWRVIVIYDETAIGDGSLSKAVFREDRKAESLQG